MNPHTSYKQHMVDRFWRYQQQRLPDAELFLEQPIGLGSRPPVFLPAEAWRNVLIDPSADTDETRGLLAMLPMSERHKWFRSMTSSQSLAQSFFGNLARQGQLGQLQNMRCDAGNTLFGDAVLSSDNFVLEFKVTHLNEPRPTSVDAYVSGAYKVAIECKLTEAEVGACSRPTLAKTHTKFAREYCNGNYIQQQDRHERCPLTQAGILYWKYVPELFRWQRDTDLIPCPLNKNYQLVRNILAVNLNGPHVISHQDGHAVLIYDDRNPAFQVGGRGLRAYLETQTALHVPTLLRKCSWQRLTSHLRERGILSWLMQELESKYGL